MKGRTYPYYFISSRLFFFTICMYYVNLENETEIKVSNKARFNISSWITVKD